MIKLGAKVKDIITGVEGIAVAKTDYLTGCTRYHVQRKADKAGKIPDLLYFDIEQIKLVKEIAKSLEIPEEALLRDRVRTAEQTAIANRYVFERLRASFKTQALQAIAFPILFEGFVRSEYLKVFKNLPCGKSQRSRIKKKRKKKIMEWFKKSVK